MLANALKTGAKTLGDDLEIRRTADYGETDEGDDLKWPGPSADTSVACFFGVKGRSLSILRDHQNMKIPTLYFDKGYTREKGESGHTLYSRVSVNSTEPTAYMMRQPREGKRAKKLGIKLLDRVRGENGHILICGSSAKYHEFHKLEDPNTYAEGLVRKIRKHSQRQIIYRPKPSWKDARPIPGASFSHGTCSIVDALRGCHAVVTHGSASAMDAILAGVPALCLGKGIATPVSEGDIEKIEEPFWPNSSDLLTWLCALAYCQWTADELRSGEAWGELKREIARQCE